MINVSIEKNNNKITSIEVKGHAGSQEKGKDLVCAAVSAVVTGACNSLASPKKFRIELKEGYAIIAKKEDYDYHDEIVLESLIQSLKTIEEDNQKYIKITTL